MDQSSVIMEELKQSINENSRIHLGLHINYDWLHDPKHLLFSLSRYKFVAKMLEGKSEVLEVGCGDGFLSKIVKQHIVSLSLTDYDPENIVEANINSASYCKDIFLHDFTKNRLEKKYDAIYALDVFEHILPQEADKFIDNLSKSLNKNGVLIIGIPSLASQQYASPLSKMGHVNCKNKEELKQFMLNYFYNVFMFSMNDEALHTGFDKMSHYIFALCIAAKP